MSSHTSGQGNSMVHERVSMDKLESSAGETSTRTDNAYEKKLMRKINWRIIPGTVLLYLLSFLDRSNVANARIEGLVDDLHISTERDTGDTLLTELQLATNTSLG